MATSTGTKRFTVIVPHIPKTGGTALRYHFAKHLAEDEIMAHGPHARTRRFFDDKFQMEELAPEDFEGIRMLLGHGVDETDIRNFRASPFRLLTVLRHPVDLTRSAYNHMRSVNARRGLEVDSEAFLKARPANFMTTFLLDRFPSFVDDPAAPREEQIVSLLRKFEYVLTTEKLGQQAGGLFEELGFDTAMEHRRVAGDKATLETTDADILARNPIDLMIFERANQLVPEAGRHNALGFDGEGRERALRAFETSTQRPRDENGYGPLAQALCMELRAETALARLDEDGDVAVRDRAAFQKILVNAWAKHRGRLKPAQLEISADRLVQWSKNRRRQLRRRQKAGQA